MGLFGSSSPFEELIEKATSETNTTEKWALILDVCDKIGNSSQNARDSLRVIVKRLNHADPHVVMQAITLLDACINNCGKNYHLEIASREFETEFRKLITKSQSTIATKLKSCLKKWAEGDFKSDSQLNLIPSLYSKLKQEGHDFSEQQTTPKREAQLSKDPNVVSSQQEEDDIAKAIELSLKEKTASPKAQSISTSLYPSVNATSTTSSTSTAAATAPVSEPRKVRALYDFEAAEDNELTFKAGEIIMVVEESDPNWWRGMNHRGEGFFPANFVTADLSAEPEDLTKDVKSSKKSVQFSDAEDSQKLEQPVEVNEDTIDRLLFLLHEADPSDPSQDSDEMLRLENVVNQMGPLIDAELERVDRKHAQLTQLSSDLIDTINLYHSLMRETERGPMFGGFSGQQPIYGPPGMFPPQNPYQRMPPSNMIPPPGMMPGQPMTFPQNAMPGSNFQMPPSSSSGPGSFQMPSSNQHSQNMMPGLNMNQQHQQPMTNGIPVNQQGNVPQQQIPGSGMIQQGVQMPGHISQQQQPQAPGQNFPPQQFSTQHQQPNGSAPQQSVYSLNQNPSNMHPQHQQQMNQMMGNLNLQSPPGSIQNHHQLGPGMQITQPMTYLQQQNDSNQNMPIYQQR